MRGERREGMDHPAVFPTGANMRRGFPPPPTNTPPRLEGRGARAGGCGCQAATPWLAVNRPAARGGEGAVGNACAGDSEQHASGTAATRPGCKPTAAGERADGGGISRDTWGGGGARASAGGPPSAVTLAVQICTAFPKSPLPWGKCTRQEKVLVGELGLEEIAWPECFFEVGCHQATDAACRCKRAASCTRMPRLALLQAAATSNVQCRGRGAPCSSVRRRLASSSPPLQ